MGILDQSNNMVLVGSTLSVAQRLPTYLLDSAGGPVENTEGPLLGSLARTANVSTPGQTNRTAKAVTITLDVTANPGGVETLTLRFHPISPVTGSASAHVAEVVTVAAVNGVYRLMVGLGASGVPVNPNNNKAFALPVPLSWSAQVAHSGVGSWTYSIGFQYS